jgi:acyl-CoA reductase-like NAD-dependent aldehyde dehydrogenase
METITMPETKAGQIKSLIQRQRDFFATGATKSVKFRKEQLAKLKNLISTHERDFIDALHKDLRKHEFEAYATEIGFILIELRKAINNVDKWAKTRTVPTPLFHFNGNSYVQPEPYGVTLIISPWNYPFQLLFAPLVGAISAGNTAVIKPSEFAPATSAIIAKVISENFAPEFIACVEGGVPESQALLEEKFDYIFFTGGTNVGRIVYQAAAKHLTPVTLELGGKSPCIVDRDTNIALTAKRIVWGKFVNAGQTCIAPDYILVDKSVKEQLVAKIIEYIKKAYGDDAQRSEHYPRVINQQHHSRLTSYFEEGDILYGGKADADDNYIEPTLLENVKLDSKVMTDEIFGPILPIIEYDNLKDAIEFINKRAKPLALYIFSKDEKKIQKVLAETSAGGVTVNDTLLHIVNPHLPFGGVGDSGIGAYHGQLSFDVFSHMKSVLRRTFLVDDPVRYAPYKLKLSWLRRLMDWTL